MTIAEQIMKKATQATEQRERRRIALNLQKKGHSLSEIAELIDASLDEVEDYLRPIAS